MPEMKFAVAALAAALCGVASAQLVPVDPDWRETEAPRPPALRKDGLIPLEIRGSTLRFGVDPDSVSIGADSVVRYVVVAASPTGVVNGIYEGIRCNTAEVKVYARHNPDSGWVPAREAGWRPLHESPHARYSLPIARTGACIGHGPNRSADKVVKDLRAPVDHRFE